MKYISIMIDSSLIRSCITNHQEMIRKMTLKTSNNYHLILFAHWLTVIKPSAIHNFSPPIGHPLGILHNKEISFSYMKVYDDSSILMQAESFLSY